jgi:TrmH family RNA methyltransferase
LISKQQIKNIRSLQQKKYRNDLNLFVIEGLKMVVEAITQVPQHIEFICFTNRYSDQIKLQISSLKIDCIEISFEEFKKISSLTSPQEILAVLKKPVNSALPETGDLLLALDGIRDPGNMGTIIRLADWFGIRQIICSADTVDCYNPKVVQASMGAILRLNLIYTDLAEWIKELRGKKDIIIYGTALKGENLYTSVLNKSAIVILGNEANGISEKIFQLVDKNLYIPNLSCSPDKSESLNVSIAAAVICSEFRRQSLVG